MTLEYREEGRLILLAQLRALTLPPATRRRVMARIGREIKKRTRANVRAQADIHGKAFVPRKRRRRRKMLAGLVKELMQRATPEEVTVGFRRGRTGVIAAQHQYGHEKTVRARRNLRNCRADDKAKPSALATKHQARTLIKDLGYRRSTGSGKKRRVSQRWIRENVTACQAGLLIRMLRDEEPKDSWVTKLPQREFFGSEPKWIGQKAAEIIDDEMWQHFQTL
uniref:Phage virion morphogenesis (Putative tail completion) protein n=1 Tax=Candidatus Kentrum sp. LFY TaxID=2126342 RepID=A0A450WI45_9GAMM|nr:MAG: phage virion morphogenesis (putative tail completion) protein [Candidatus Kentron sp. LFY]